MFQFSGFASYSYVFTARYPCGWVSPFGHLRVNVCCRLAGAFRRLPRPSSPLTAKASTVCAYSLDHITPSCLGCNTPYEHTTITSNSRPLPRPALASTTRWRLRLKRSLLPLFSKNRTRPQCQAISKWVCADHDSRMVEPDGIEPTTPCLQSRCSPS